MNNKKLHYKDVVLANPVYSEVRSRDDISSDVEFLGWKFKSPCIPANMQTAISFEKAEEMMEKDQFYILHRFYEYDDILDWIRKNQKNDKPISISIGVKEKDKWLINQILFEWLRVDFITIDVAFGHSILMKEMIEYIKYRTNGIREPKIIAGNVCTQDAVKDLESWGADAIKTGLSMGKSCQTYNSTGVGSPMFSTVLECSQVANVPIIADGGIREASDVCKALVAGATMVMIGSEFVKCKDSPAEWETEIDEVLYKLRSAKRSAKSCRVNTNNKIYFGSASVKNKGHDKYVEGSEQVLLPCNGLTYDEYIEKTNQGIRSCMSYHNLRTVSEMNTIVWSIHTP